MIGNRPRGHVGETWPRRACTAPVSTALPGGWSSTLVGRRRAAHDRHAARLPGTGGLVAERVRVGPVLFDLELRRRRSTLVVRLVHRQGPVPTLCLRLPSPGPGLVEVDGVTLTGQRGALSLFRPA